MKIAFTVRGSRIIRLAALICIIVPLIYLLATWSDEGGTKAGAIRSRLSRKRNGDVPKLIDTG